MKTRPLGTSPIQVTELCLGTMTWGTQNTQAEAFEQMDFARQHGLTFWDTAEMYPTNPVTFETVGNTETIIGNYFKERGGREEIVLATKIAGPGLYKLRDEENITPATLETALASSLRRLQTDYLDLYQLHWPNRGSYHFSQYWHYAGPDSTVPTQNTAAIIDDLRAILRKLAEFIQAGKIRTWGLSNDTSWGTMTFLRLADELGLPRPVSIQNEYSLLCRLFEPDLADIAMREQVGLLAYSPLANGLLTQKYHKGARPPGSRVTLPGYGGQRVTTQMQAATDAYRDLAAQAGLDPAQMALAFTLAMPFTTSSIIGATSLAQLKTNLEAADLTLSPDVLAGIEAIYRQYPRPY